MASLGGRHYVVIPTLVDIEASSAYPAASTSVYCPFRTLPDHNGYASADYDSVDYTGTTAFFKEIVGVIPMRIYNYHTGDSIVLSESNIYDYIDKIRYNYLVDGHKVITIVYNQDAFNTTFQEIEFKLLFDDGEYHTVKQPIIDSRCFDTDTGIPLDYSDLFNFSPTSSVLKSPNLRSLKTLGSIKVANAGSDKLISFNTYAYTDPKFFDDSNVDLSPSQLNRDYFLLAYTNYSTLTLGELNPQLADEDGIVYPFKNNGMMWEFRQSSRANYGYDVNGGISRGTISQDINPLGDISFQPMHNSQNDGNHANNGYRSVDYLGFAFSGLDGSTGSYTSNITLDGAFDGGGFSNVSPADLLAANESTTITNRGFCSTSSIYNDRTHVNAFYLPNGVTHRKNNYTGRRFDGVIYGIRNADYGVINDFASTDDYYDTVGALLKNTAQGLMSAATQEGMSGGVSLKSIGNWGEVNTSIPDTIGNYLIFDYVAPQDVISNFILGEHTFYLSRPHHVTDVNAFQNEFQSSLTAALFLKAKHPNWTASGASTNFASPTEDGVVLDKTNNGGYLLTGIPYHYYVDSYQSITFGTGNGGIIDNATVSSIDSTSNIEGYLAGGIDLAFETDSTVLSINSPFKSRSYKIIETENNWELATFHEIISSNNQFTYGFSRPSLDRNSVQYSQSPLAEPFYTNNTNVNAIVATGSGIIPAANANNYISNNNDYLSYYSGTHNEVVALVTQTGAGAWFRDGDDRKVYTRGCINMPRGESIPESNFELDLLVKPALSNVTGVQATELQFNVKYKVGVSDILPNTVFPSLSNSTTINCGCAGSLTNLDWEDSGGADFDVDNALDIFRVKYTPGRNIFDSSLFPINETDFSPGTIVSDEGNDLRKLTINLDDELATELDRPLVDVELSNFNWDEETIYISTIQIAGRTGAVTQIGQEAPNANIDDLNFSPQTFQFVSLGAQIVEGGGVDEEIPGCTDPGALNYNPLATEDDFSCILCDLTDSNSGFAPANINSMIVSRQISPQAAITGTSQPFGMQGWYNNPNYLYGIWHQGQIGNAFNHWGPALEAAVTESGGVAVPYGEAFGDDASFYTQFHAEFNFTPSDTSSDTNFAAFIQELLDQGSFSSQDWGLGFYEIDQWTGTEAGEWGVAYDVSQDATLTIPITDYANNQGIGTMVNQGTASNPKFASWGLTWTGYASEVGGGFLPNHDNFLADPYVQTYLDPGKHYIAVLVLSIGGMINTYEDPDTGAGVECSREIAIPFNFWVTFCGCDVYDAENYVGALFDFPWSNVYPGGTPFPAGYTSMEICKAESRIRKTKRNAEDDSGFCITPVEFNCDTFIDLCIQSVNPSCIPAPTSENPANQDFNGTINVSIYGAYTNNEDDEYEFVLLGDQLFTFNLYLFDGEFTGDFDSAVNSYSFANVDDYIALGFNPYNDNHLLVSFANLPAGSYTVVLQQTNVFSFQEEPCPPVVLDLASLALDGGEDCPDLIVGCMDSASDDFDPSAEVPCDDCCTYLNCEDVFLTGGITNVTTTNTIINCVETELPGGDPQVFVNTLVDSNIGTFTIPGNGYNAAGLTDFVTGTFVTAYCQVFAGNSGAAVTNILEGFASQNAAITDQNRTEIIPIGTDTITFGGFLPFDDEGDPILTSDPSVVPGLSVGYYVVMLIPAFIDVAGDECVTEIIDNFDSLFFFSIGATLNFTECTTPCNDQTNPEDCPDAVPGCMDENATNYNEDCAGNAVIATYDDGCCHNGGQEECDQNPSLPGCEDCDTTDTSGLPGFRDCDEVNDSTEGCCDPAACNFDPTVDVCMQSLCEYCCAEDDDCEDGPTTDECEDENGNILPDCVQPECPDPTNPECDTPVVDPCPADVDCPGPPDPECVILGNCPEGPGGGDEDEDIIIEDEIITEVTCQPALGNYSSFDEVRTAAMTCSANEGSKLLFKLRSGVKHDRTDLIKLMLINYLFNFAINESCMSSCTDVIDEKARQLGINKPSCKERWIAGGREIWTSTSTYGKGAVVGVLRLESGRTHLEYYISVASVGSGDPHPKARLSKKASSKWAPCITVRGKNFNLPGQTPYVNTLYEFMAKFCENCHIYQTGSEYDGNYSIKSRTPQKDAGTSGLVDEDGNEIKLF